MFKCRDRGRFCVLPRCDTARHRTVPCLIFHAIIKTVLHCERMKFLMKKIVLTGGGTAGHVTPNMSLIPYLKDKNYEIHYIGSENGIEYEMIKEIEGVTYHSIRSGKLRRYFSWRNFSDPFRVAAGYFDAKKLMKAIKPDVVFSKGGFVSVPVVAAAHSKKVPVVCHESDITPGLATKLSVPYANKVCVTFPDVLSTIKGSKGVYTGTPIRAGLFHGNSEIARKDLGFDSKPVLLVMGGSLGAKAINEALREALPNLIAEYNIIHLCGKGHIDKDLAEDKKINKKYAQFEFVSDQLPDFMALADFVLSRAGSNSIHEFLALNKPMLLIPLPLSASRGDQILNAKSFTERGFALTLNQEDLTPSSLVNAINDLQNQSESIRDNMIKNDNSNGTEAVLKVIYSVIKSEKSKKLSKAK